MTFVHLYPDMVDDPQELILEHLRHIRAKVDANDTGLRDIKQMITGLREEVNALRGDILRQERAIAALEADFDRIKTRLDLSDV